MVTIDITDEEQQWLVDALYELKGLRGWAWDAADFERYRNIIEALGENADNF